MTEQSHVTKLNKPEEMRKSYKHTTLHTEGFIIVIISEETESVIKNLSTKNIPRSGCFSGELFQPFK